MRSGRFNQPTVSDISIEWLMQVYLSTFRIEGKNIHLIPVAINYDRLFEMRNLANEIVSGQTDDLFSMLTVTRMLREQSNQAVGKVYMTFGEAISLKDYLKENRFEPLNQANFDAAALHLTSHLVLQHEYACPITLNMIVASLLLQI